MSKPESILSQDPDDTSERLRDVAGRIEEQLPPFGTGDSTLNGAL